MTKQDKSNLDDEFMKLIDRAQTETLNCELLESFYDLGYNRGVHLKPIKQEKIKINSEIYYLELLIKANKVLYYNGLSILDDIDYDHLQDRLEKLDSTNTLVNFVGWSKDWLRNKGYRK